MSVFKEDTEKMPDRFITKVNEKIEHAKHAPELSNTDIENILPKETAQAVPEGIPNRNYLFFDIETFMDYPSEEFKNTVYESKKDNRLKDPDKIHQNKTEIFAKGALSPLTGKVIMAGFLITGEKDKYEILQQALKYETELSTKEGNLIELCWDTIEAYCFRKQYNLVTWNGVRFDLPYLLIRSMKYGIVPKVPRFLLSQIVNPYPYGQIEEMRHIDLSTKIEGSQALFTHFLLGKQGFENEGKFIHEWYEKKDYDAIEGKNKSDLINLYEIFMKVKDIIV